MVYFTIKVDIIDFSWQGFDGFFCNRITDTCLNRLALIWLFVPCHLCERIVAAGFHLLLRCEQHNDQSLLNDLKWKKILQCIMFNATGHWSYQPKC